MGAHIEINKEEQFWNTDPKYFRLWECVWWSWLLKVFQVLPVAGWRIFDVASDIFGLPRKWFLFIYAYKSIIFCTHNHEDSLGQVVGIHAEVWNILCVARRDRDVEIFQAWNRYRVSLDMFCSFGSSFWIYFVVLVFHFGYILCCDNSFWIYIVVLMAHPVSLFYNNWCFF